jgi:hypothetical protein
MPRCITNLFCTPRCPHHRHLQQRRLRSVHFFNQTQTTLSVHSVNRTQPSSLAATKAATATLRPHLFLVIALFCATSVHFVIHWQRVALQECSAKAVAATLRPQQQQHHQLFLVFLVSALFCASQCTLRHTSSARRSARMQCISSNSNSESTSIGECALLCIAVYTSSYICSASHCKNAVQKQ